MRRIALLLTLFATALACLLHAVPAQAQPIRVFVALTGSDANPCTFASPCKSAQHAHDVVAAGGEVRMLDPGSYGLLTITKSISILGDGHGGIAASGGAVAITINAGANDSVNIRGLVIEGFGTGSEGIKVNSGASLNIQDSIIRKFTGAGIDYVTTTFGSQLNVSRTIVSDMATGSNSVNIAPTGPGTVNGVFDRVELDRGDNGLVVINTNSTSQKINLTIVDSVVSNNATSGILVGANALAQVMVQNCTISNNGAGLIPLALAIVRVTRSAITGNTTGFVSTLGGSLISFGDNSLAGNTTDGAPTSTLALH